MSEYIYTDLPKYVKTTPRENFSNSVVKSGSALIFSEDGENLVAKLPDGTFKEIGGGSGEYYRCASVDTSTKTWTGYKAVLEEGGYVFGTDVTTGLTYDLKTPEVGNIYSKDALIQVASIYEKPSEDGLIFNAPLATQKATDETGKILTYNGTISHTTLDNKQCAYLESNAYISATVSDLPGDAAVPRTISFCCRFVEKYTHAYFLSLGDSGRLEIYYSWSGPVLWISTSSGAISPEPGYEDMPVQGDKYLNPDTWYHIVITYHPALFSDGRNGARVYKNGAYIGSAYKDLTTNGTSVRIGAYGSKYTSKTYISDVMLYNKALSQEEITSLYNRVKSW